MASSSTHGYSHNNPATRDGSAGLRRDDCIADPLEPRLTSEQSWQPGRLGVKLEPLLGDGPPVEGMPAESPELVSTLRSASLFALERGHNHGGTEHA